jgi:cytidyltransferase-like protein
MKIGVFTGSFDPFTIGHDDIVKRALPLFDQIVIGIGVNVAPPTGGFPAEIANLATAVFENATAATGMRERLAAALGVEKDAISIKATTEEGLGFTGEGLGIAAHAVCLIEQ